MRNDFIAHETKPCASCETYAYASQTPGCIGNWSFGSAPALSNGFVYDSMDPFGFPPESVLRCAPLLPLNSGRPAPTSAPLRPSACVPLRWAPVSLRSAPGGPLHLRTDSSGHQTDPLHPKRIHCSAFARQTTNYLLQSHFLFV